MRTSFIDAESTTTKAIRLLNLNLILLRTDATKYIQWGDIQATCTQWIYKCLFREITLLMTLLEAKNAFLKYSETFYHYECHSKEYVPFYYASTSTMIDIEVFYSNSPIPITLIVPVSLSCQQGCCFKRWWMQGALQSRWKRRTCRLSY